MEYKETYRNLCHGTDEKSAEKIRKKGFIPSESKGNWCGAGIYFYDIKAKAWWSAQRTCNEIKKQTGEKVSPKVVFADIIELPKKEIFDLRVHTDLCQFQSEMQQLLEKAEARLEIDGIEDETERIITLRSMLIDFYAKRKNVKLVIGTFRQRPQEKHRDAIEFADSFQIVFGAETIYCVKEQEILTNIH